MPSGILKTWVYIREAEMEGEAWSPWLWFGSGGRARRKPACMGSGENLSLVCPFNLCLLSVVRALLDGVENRVT